MFQNNFYMNFEVITNFLILDNNKKLIEIYYSIGNEIINLI